MNDYQNVSTKGLVAAIGPTLIDSQDGFYYPFIRLSKLGWRSKIQPHTQVSPFEVSMIISSGSLIAVSALNEIGMMEQSFFIDYVDTEWCLRARAKGYKIFVSTSAKMSHRIGDKMIKVFSWHIPVHSAFRRYYRIRNGLYLVKMQHIPLLIKIRENIVNTLHQLLLIITQHDKIAQIRSWCRAMKDGVGLK